MKKILLLALLGGMACHTHPLSPYETVSGPYHGNLTTFFSSSVAITFTQDGTTLGGTWSSTQLTTSGSVQESGTVSGTVAAGSDPNVSLTLTSTACPSNKMTFSGMRDDATQQITLNGAFLVWTPSPCIATSFNNTLVLIPGVVVAVGPPL